ncbi:MAG: hypothetical protein NTW38_02040 [Candidatus Aminicenantes bacterium]|nr:hypothetical protein [Candidatus Aminicenantes bacterium]
MNIIFFKRLLKSIPYIAGGFVILDGITDWFHIVIPVIVFLWNIVLQEVPIYLGFILIFAYFIFSYIKSLRLSNKERFLISFLGSEERGLNLILNAYKRNFFNESRVRSRCISAMNHLERTNLITVTAVSGGMTSIQDELYKLTKKGIKRFNKIDEKIKSKTNEIYLSLKNEKTKNRIPERIEPNNEIIFILNVLANQPGISIDKDSLMANYQKKFSDKSVSHFNTIWNLLERNALILQDAGPTGYGSTDNYSLTDKGFDYLAAHNNHDKGMKSIFFNNATWIIDHSEQKYKGPYCSTCYDSEKLNMNLLPSKSPHVFVCGHCNRRVVCMGPPPNNPELT